MVFASFGGSLFAWSPVMLKLNVVFPLHLPVFLLGAFDKRQHKRFGINVWGKDHQNMRTCMFENIIYNV